MGLHCLNVVRPDVEEKLLSVRMNYLTGNIKVLVIRSALAVYTTLLRHVGTEPLGTYLLPYMWYNTINSMYERTMVQDGISTFRKEEKIVPSIRTICFGGSSVDEASGGRGKQLYHAMQQLSQMFFRTLKKIVCNNPVTKLCTQKRIQMFRASLHCVRFALQMLMTTYHSSSGKLNML